MLQSPTSGGSGRPRLSLPGSCAAAIALAMLGSLALVPIPWGDSTGAVYGPISLLCERDWDFDEFPFLYEQGGPRGPALDHAVLTVHPDPSGTRLLSFTGLGVKLVSLPVAALVLRPWVSASSEGEVLLANRLTVIACAVGILWAFWLAAKAVASPRTAAVATAALFFGTTLWPQCRQTLWSNQAALLGTTALLPLVLRARGPSGLSPRLGAAMGAAAGWALLCRPATALISGPLLLAAALEAWRRRDPRLPAAALAVGLAAAPLFALLLLDNAAHTGSPFRSTFLAVAAEIGTRLGQEGGAFSGRPLLGLAGLLVSPSRGLFVFSPFLLLAAPGAVAAVRRRDPVGIALLVGCALTLAVNASYADWWGASCWGPRRLMDLLPGLSFLGLDPRWRDESTLPSWLRVAGPPLLAISISIQALGTLAYDSRWDMANEPTARLRGDESGLRYDASRASLSRLWSLRDGVLADAVRSLSDPARGWQFGRENRITLALGWRWQPAIPRCAELRGVDRWPAPPPPPR